MSSKLIKYEINLWKKALAVEEKKLAKLSEDVTSDPQANLIKIYTEFNDLLESRESRTTKEFARKAKELSQREKKENQRAKRYDPIKAIDKEVDQKILVAEITSKISMLEFLEIDKSTK